MESQNNTPSFGPTHGKVWCPGASLSPVTIELTQGRALQIVIRLGGAKARCIVLGFHKE